MEGQTISNLSFIHADLDSDNFFTTNSIQFIERPIYNYLGLQFGNNAMYMNDDLISEGGHPFIDRQSNFYHLIKMNKENGFEAHTEIYLKGIDENLNFNLARFDGNVSVTTHEDLVYLYGSVKYTDSLFIKNEFISSIPRGGAFVFTFNEELELLDEFFYGMDTIVQQQDVELRVDANGDYHLSGRFSSTDTSFSLPIADQSLDIIDNISNDNTTYYYVKVNALTKLVEFANVYGGGQTDWQLIAGFVLDEDENACVLFNQFGNLEFNGELIPDAQYLYDVTQVCINEDSIIHYIHYEGPSFQEATSLHSFGTGANYEIIGTGGGPNYPLIIDSDSFYFDYPSNRLMMKRDASGEMQWMQNIYGPIGAINILDLNLHQSTESLWLSGSLRKDSTFYIEDVPLMQDFYGEGFLMELDEETGAFKRVFWSKIESDLDIEPHSQILKIGQENDGEFKIITHLGSRLNEEQNFYDYTIGDLTLPVSGKGELVIFDFKPDASSSTVEQEKMQSLFYPNPISPGQSFYSSDANNESYSVYNIGGIKVGEIRNNDTFPALIDGIYYLKSRKNGILGRIVVLGSW